MVWVSKYFFSIRSSCRLLLLIATMFPLIYYNVPSISLWYLTMFPQYPFDILQCSLNIPLISYNVPSTSLWHHTMFPQYPFDIIQCSLNIPLISYNVPSISLWYPTMFPQYPFDIPLKNVWKTEADMLKYLIFSVNIFNEYFRSIEPTNN